MAEPEIPPQITVDELIERCLRGDQAAWEAIVRQHWRKVFGAIGRTAAGTVTTA